MVLMLMTIDQHQYNNTNITTATTSSIQRRHQHHQHHQHQQQQQPTTTTTTSSSSSIQRHHQHHQHHQQQQQRRSLPTGEKVELQPQPNRFWSRRGLVLRSRERASRVAPRRMRHRETATRPPQRHDRTKVPPPLGEQDQEHSRRVFRVDPQSPRAATLGESVEEDRQRDLCRSRQPAQAGSGQKQPGGDQQVFLQQPKITHGATPGREFHQGEFHLDWCFCFCCL